MSDRAASTIERKTVIIKTPGLDPDNDEHVTVIKGQAEKAHEGFMMKFIGRNVDGHIEVVLERISKITRVTSVSKNKKRMNLPDGMKPSQGEEMLQRYQDQHGKDWYMTSYEPAINKAELTKLTQAEIVALESTAVALGVKPWQIDMTTRRDGGYDFTLPSTFIPSKHTEKLEEVAQGVVGNAGWYVKVKAAERTASMIPSDPPSSSRRRRRKVRRPLRPGCSPSTSRCRSSTRPSPRR